MTQHALIQYLREYIQIQARYWQLTERANSLRTSIANAKKPAEPIPGAAGTVYICVILFFLAALPVSLISMLVFSALSRIPGLGLPIAHGLFAITNALEQLSFFQAHKWLSFFCAAGMIPGTVILILSILFCISTVKENKEKRSALERQRTAALAQIPQWEHNLKAVLGQAEAVKTQLQIIESRGIVPAEYLPSAYQLLSYLETGQAGNLKEAVSLLEKACQDNASGEAQPQTV